MYIWLLLCKVITQYIIRILRINTINLLYCKIRLFVHLSVRNFSSFFCWEGAFLGKQILDLKKRRYQKNAIFLGTPFRIYQLKHKRPVLNALNGIFCDLDDLTWPIIVLISRVPLTFSPPCLKYPSNKGGKKLGFRRLPKFSARLRRA